jgi:hypothetical protein
MSMGLESFMDSGKSVMKSRPPKVVNFVPVPDANFRFLATSLVVALLAVAREILPIQEIKLRFGFELAALPAPLVTRH